MARKASAVSHLGPGLVAGASNNDPTTVATLAVIGSTTGYALTWLVILVIPMLMIVQAVSATVGVVAKTGLVDAIRKRYGRGWTSVALVCVLAVNLLTLGADIEGGGAALSLLTGWPYQWFNVPFAVVISAFLVLSSGFRTVQRVLQYVMVVFVAYIAAAFLARPNWGDVLFHTIVPQLSYAPEFVAGAIALLGTTLTSYAYIWETIEEAAERPPLRYLRVARLDAVLGMAMAGLIFWFIVVATGATLGIHHQSVKTAQDAARALAPLAGQFAAALFGAGLLASAILAVPVLAGTSAYVVAEAFQWRRGLDKRFQRAPRFYLALLASLAIGAGLTFLRISPIQLLFASSIAGGLATPVTLILLVLIARDRAIMGKHRISPWLAAAGFAVTAVVTLASIVFLWLTFVPGGQ